MTKDSKPQRALQLFPRKLLLRAYNAERHVAFLNRTLKAIGIGAPLAALVLGCSSGGIEGGAAVAVPTGPASAGSVPEPGAATAPDDVVLIDTDPGMVAPATGPGDGDEACVAEHSEASLSEVHLVVLLDQSGSMGNRRQQRQQKWDPVTVALNAFFASPEATGLSASLTLFPSMGGTQGPDSPSCLAGNYQAPVVPVTPLPSPTFAQYIDGVTPDGIGTPTQPALEGAMAQASAIGLQSPGARVAVVLVTDGEPTECNDNDVEDVAAAAAAVAQDIPTYVIGVGDSLTALNQIAASGGTNQAFLVSLNDPAQTQAEFSQAINEIRGRVLSCDTEIPVPPAGKQLDPKAVNVQYTTGAGVITPLAQSVDCADGQGWRYDDPVNPTLIQLCPATCSSLQADSTVQLEVLFGCATIIR